MKISQITIDQHFVPQCYLKQFTNNDGKVFVYKKDGHLLNRKYSPRSILFKKLIYELNLKDPDNKIENFFKKIEDRYSILSKKLLSLQHPEDFNLSNDEQTHLLLFVLRVALGNPSQHEHLHNKDFDNLRLRELEVNNLSDEDKRESIINLQEHNRQELPISIEVAFQKEFLLELILKKKFIFFIVNETNIFLTSDNPVVQWYENATGLFDGMPRFSDINYGVALSPYVYLKIIDQETDPNIKNLSLCCDKNGEIVKKHNQLMFKQCKDFVYGNIKNYKIPYLS